MCQVINLATAKQVLPGRGRSLQDQAINLHGSPSVQTPYNDYDNM